jgi:hypothetical protein
LGAPFNGGYWQLGDVRVQVAEKILDFRVKDTTATDEKARTRVLNAIAFGDSSLEDVPPTRHEHHFQFERALRRSCAGIVLREAGFNGDVGKIKWVLSRVPCLAGKMDDPKVQGAHMETPLHAAAAAGHTQAMQCFLELSANVNAFDVDGESPLHHAAFVGNCEAIKLLMAWKADVDRLSFSSQTPLDVALENSQESIPFGKLSDDDIADEVVSLLRCRGGQLGATRAGNSGRIASQTHDEELLPLMMKTAQEVSLLTSKVQESTEEVSLLRSQVQGGRLRCTDFGGQSLGAARAAGSGRSAALAVHYGENRAGSVAAQVLPEPELWFGDAMPNVVLPLPLFSSISTEAAPQP